MPELNANERQLIIAALIMFHDSAEDNGRDLEVVESAALIGKLRSLWGDVR